LEVAEPFGAGSKGVARRPPLGSGDGPVGAVAAGREDQVQGPVGHVGSTRSAVPSFPVVGFSGPSPEPDVRLPPHPALHQVQAVEVATAVVVTHFEGIAVPR
jgi:hypothetical protein